MTTTNTTAAASSEKRDVYETVTAKIVAAIEAGAAPWACPWKSGFSTGLPTRWSGEAYKGINILLLWAAQAEQGFQSSRWLTFAQAVAAGGKVKKGAKGTQIVFASPVQPKADEQAEEGEKQGKRFFMKSYVVFNEEQCEGLPLTAPAPEITEPKDVEAFFEATGAVIHHGGNRAYYAPALDTIQLPEPGAFKDYEGYFGTKAHELVHWTGHESRCAREFGKRFGDKAYAFEELVAELGSAFLCADLSITPEPREDHAAYLADWLRVLKQDKKAIFMAASAAQKATDFLHVFSVQREAVAA